MASKEQRIRHVFGGGWATNRGKVASLSQDASGNAVMPFLLMADNVVFNNAGAPKKVPGALQLGPETTGLGNDHEIHYVYDFWNMGVLGTPQQKVIVFATDTTIPNLGAWRWKDATVAGGYTTIIGGHATGSVPSVAQLDENVVLFTDDSSLAPRIFDGTTSAFVTLPDPGGLGTDAATNLSFGATHKGRMWAAGDIAHPSRLYYTETFEPQSWEDGANSGGHFDIHPGDGDKITGIASHKNQLWIFKGPNRQSITRLTGSSPDDWVIPESATEPYAEGISAVHHNAIFRMLDDLAFVSADGNIYSLAATSAFGDYREASLTRDIEDWILENVDQELLKFTTTAVHQPTSTAYITYRLLDNSNVMVLLDFGFSPIRMSLVSVYDADSVGEFVDTESDSNRTLIFGSRDQYVRKFVNSENTVDGAIAIEMKATTPFITYTDAIEMKIISYALLEVDSDAGDRIVFTTRSERDDLNVRTVNGDVGDDGYHYIIIDNMEGEFRSVQYEFENPYTFESMIIESFTVSLQRSSDDLTQG